MKFSRAIDLYIADMRAEGRINSPNTERGYRDTLGAPRRRRRRTATRAHVREDVKRTLRRWPNPNTQRKNRSILVSFYDWAMEEGLPQGQPGAPDAAAEGRKPPKVYRLTRDEVVGVPRRRRRPRRERASRTSASAPGSATHELRGLQGRHFERARLGVGQRRHRQGRPRALGAGPARARAGRREILRVERVWDRRGVDRRVRAPRAALARPRRATPAADGPQAKRRVAPGAPHRRDGARPARRHPRARRRRTRCGTRSATTSPATPGSRTPRRCSGTPTSERRRCYTGAPTLDELAAAIEGFRFARGSEQTFYPLTTPQTR